MELSGRSREGSLDSISRILVGSTEEIELPRVVEGLYADITGVIDLGTHREYNIIVKQWRRRQSDGVLYPAQVMGEARRRFSEFRLLSQMLSPSFRVPFNARRYLMSESELIKQQRVKKLSKWLNDLLRVSGDELPDDLVQFLEIDAELLTAVVDKRACVALEKPKAVSPVAQAKAKAHARAQAAEAAEAAAIAESMAGAKAAEVVEVLLADAVEQAELEMTASSFVAEVVHVGMVAASAVAAEGGDASAKTPLAMLLCLLGCAPK